MITIGLPVYNAESTVIDTLRSVYAQSVTDWELVIVDDGSIDRSIEIVEAVSTHDTRVRVLRNSRNLGLSACLNRITSEAQGEYIARLDADDLMHPDRLKMQAEVLDDQPGIDAIQTGMLILDKALKPTGIRSKQSLDTRPEKVLRRGLLFHATIMGRTSWFRQNPYDETLMRAEDHELWCRTCNTSHFANIPEPLYLCREVGTVTLSKYLKSLEAQRRIYEVYGPASVGRLGTLELVLRSHLKGGIYAIFSALDRTDYLVKQRSQPLSELQLSAALEAIQTILQTPVPGLE